MDKNIIWIIGTGPGSKEYLTQAAIDKAAEQTLLVGSQKALELFSRLNKEKYVFTNNTDNLIKFLKNNYRKKKIAVLVTGDPGIYSLSKTIKKHFKEDELQFIPGISSVSLFFAKIGLPFEDVKIISVHGRPINRILKNIKHHKKVCILADYLNTPQKIAETLIKENMKANAFVGQNLSLANELIVKKNLEELLDDSEDYQKVLLYLEFKEIN